MLEIHFNIVICIQKQNLTVECCLIFFFRDFLPRGSGIVTRRPLVLQLVNCPTGKNPRKTHTHTKNALAGVLNAVHFTLAPTLIKLISAYPRV